MKIQEVKAILEKSGYACAIARGALIVKQGKTRVETLRNFPICPWELDLLVNRGFGD